MTHFFTLLIMQLSPTTVTRLSFPFSSSLILPLSLLLSKESSCSCFFSNKMSSIRSRRYVVDIRQNLNNVLRFKWVHNLFISWTRSFTSFETAFVCITSSIDGSSTFTFDTRHYHFTCFVSIIHIIVNVLQLRTSIGSFVHARKIEEFTFCLQFFCPWIRRVYMVL